MAEFKPCSYENVLQDVGEFRCKVDPEPHAVGCGCEKCRPVEFIRLKKRSPEDRQLYWEMHVLSAIQIFDTKLAALDAKLDRLAAAHCACMATRLPFDGMSDPEWGRFSDTQRAILWLNYIKHGPRQEASGEQG